jgi:two-component system sensor kinase FixL
MSPENSSLAAKMDRRSRSRYRLQSALEDLAASIGSQRRINCRFESTSPVRVANYSTATHLYRIAQEAVSNALRHSRADEIVISLSRCDEQIVLEVGDNGVGMNRGYGATGVTAPTKGLGLGTMRYRCGMIGGTFHLQGRESGGTSVRCVVPEKAGNCDD